MRNKERQETEHQPESEAGTRERIIAAAVNEFAEFGRAGARVDRIAAAAGVNKAMIYYHFTSKDKLYLEVIKAFFVEIGRRANLIVGETRGLKEALTALATLHNQIVSHNPQVRTLFLRELADMNPEIMDTIVRSFEESGMVQVIRERVSSEMDSGRLRPVDPRQLIPAFISMSIGYHFLFPITDKLMRLEDRARFVEERVPIIVDIFLNGIRVR